MAGGERFAVYLLEEAVEPVVPLKLEGILVLLVLAAILNPCPSIFC